MLKEREVAVKEANVAQQPTPVASEPVAAPQPTPQATFQPQGDNTL